MHPVEVLANLDLVAEEANQEKVVEARGLGSLLNLLQSSEDEIIRQVATGAVANLATNWYKLGGRFLLRWCFAVDCGQCKQ
ncbi:hypothetical protein CY35_16G079300 [Sphagnum magellanicum]|nr:hypothetical protein CY35_16G079300 [Sphagnum magellanicum]